MYTLQMGKQKHVAVRVTLNQLHGNVVYLLQHDGGLTFLDGFFFLWNIFSYFMVRQDVFLLTVNKQLRASSPQFRNAVAETSLSVDLQPSCHLNAVTQTDAVEIIQIPKGSLSAFCSHEQLLTSEQKKRQHRLLRSSMSAICRISFISMCQGIALLCQRWVGTRGGEDLMRCHLD